MPAIVPIEAWGLKAFLEELKSDLELQEKLKTASGPDAVVAAAKEAGINTSVEELKLAFWFHNEIESNWDKVGWWGFEEEVP